MHYQLACFEEARRQYLDQCAYMHQALNTFAEQRGGVEQLSPDDARVYRGRTDGLIKLVAYDDAAIAAIAEMKDWIDELINEKRSLMARLRDIERPERTLIPKCDRDNEIMRRQSILRATEKWADHY
jgi:predicted Rdx family selenoprotein